MRLPRQSASRVSRAYGPKAARTFYLLTRMRSQGVSLLLCHGLPRSGCGPGSAQGCCFMLTTAAARPPDGSRMLHGHWQ